MVLYCRAVSRQWWQFGLKPQMKLPLRDCGRFDTVIATQKKTTTKNHYLSFCPNDASKSSNNHQFLSLLNKNEFCSMKIPPQRNNISSSETFLKIALPIFSKKKIIKKERENIFNGSPVHKPSLWRHSIIRLKTDTLVPLSYVPPCPVISMSLIYSFCVPSTEYSHLMPLPTYLPTETICTPKDNYS